jgi:hypothetical protein
MGILGLIHDAWVTFKISNDKRKIKKPDFTLRGVLINFYSDHELEDLEGNKWDADSFIKHMEASQFDRELLSKLVHVEWDDGYLYLVGKDGNVHWDNYILRSLTRIREKEIEEERRDYLLFESPEAQERAEIKSNLEELRDDEIFDKWSR